MEKKKAKLSFNYHHISSKSHLISSGVKESCQHDKAYVLFLLSGLHVFTVSLHVAITIKRLFFCVLTFTQVPMS